MLVELESMFVLVNVLQRVLYVDWTCGVSVGARLGLQQILDLLDRNRRVLLIVVTGAR
jgi:hypothetical protein